MKLIKIIGVIGDDITAEMFTEKLESLAGDITIHIDSPGGSVFDGVSIYNAIRAYSLGKVTVIIDSVCASIASYIALAGDTVQVHDNSAYMIHNAHTGVRGDAQSFENTAKTLRGVNDVMLAAYHKKSGISKEKIANYMNNETYFFGEDIITYGFADKLIGTKMTASIEELTLLAKEKVTTCTANCKNRPTDQIEKVARLLYKEEIKPNALALEAKKIMEELS